MHKNITHKPKAGLGENMTYRLIGADGKAKQLFAQNTLGMAIVRAARKFVDPIARVTNTAGEVTGSYVKQGWLNYLAAYGVAIPYITGNYTYSMRGANLVTTTGKALVAARINGYGSPAAATYIAIGIGTAAAVVGDTTLGSEITTNGGQRASATASVTTTDTTNDTARLVLTFNFTGTFAVTEAGALNAASSGTLLNRQVFTAVNVISGDSLQVTIDIDVD